ncbi:uncharacterized protein LOC131880413 [Tigriopus californicus]|uniref:uncharacterized protein LOC131880413 n=1 Tax=Tigriopus californicus TaxID=6832 RepID=UPI0027DA4742|nr:uncharacterized protein LOC131880413 [Tigriopus californicus]
MANQPLWTMHESMGSGSGGTIEGQEQQTSSHAKSTRSATHGFGKFRLRSILLCENWTNLAHLSTSKLFLLQSLCVWLALCVPGNITAGVLYYQVTYGSAVMNGPNKVATNETSVINVVQLTCAYWIEFCQVERVNALAECEELLNRDLTTIKGLHLDHIQRLPLLGDDLLEHEKKLYQDILDEVVPQHEFDCVPGENLNLPSGSQIWNSSDSLLFCHESRATYSPWVAKSKFWIEGVAVTVVGIFGMTGNIIAIIVLRRIKTNRNFNNLLITLSFSDFLLILDVVVEMSLIGIFMSKEPHWFKVSYPYILHPLRGFIQTTAIYMVVAVSSERFKAVCYPLSHRQSYHKFVIVAVVCSVTLELPRFLEFKLVKNNTDYWTTDLMEDPSYIQFNSYWNELFATSALPLICLMYMNFKIYQKIRASSQFAKRFVRRSTTNTSLLSNKSTTCLPKSDSRYLTRTTGSGNGRRVPLNLIDEAETMDFNLVNGSQPDSNQTPKTRPPAANERLALVTEVTTTVSVNLSETRGLSPTQEIHDDVSNQCCTLKNSSNRRSVPPNSSCLDRVPSNDVDTSLEEIQLKPLMHKDSTASSQINNRNQRKRREKSTIVLVSIVLIFITCHTYRLSLRIYEVSHPSNNTLEHYQFCYNRGLYHIPVAFYVLVNFHHLFLVINSSVNFIIYCCVGREFRSHMYEWCSRSKK